MSTQPKTFLTPEQYLAIEREAPYKSEYFNGEMFAMSGVRKGHDLIAGNVHGSTVDQLPLAIRASFIPAICECAPLPNTSVIPTLVQSAENLNIWMKKSTRS